MGNNTIAIRAVDHIDDYEPIRAWLIARDIPSHYADHLPERGFTVFDDNGRVAAGFLRKCEGGHGIIDSLITNPAASKESRDIALDLLFSYLISLAKKQGFKLLFGATTDKNTRLRAARHGFVALSHVPMALSLR